MQQYQFDVFGIPMLVKRRESQWLLFTKAQGLMAPVNDVVIPNEFTVGELPVFLADMYHELATSLHPDVTKIS
ncbi:DUF7661 family protein [Neptunicella marina]|uniref:DUF7661 domain-containing protein n=1 Tax=Neptunicella marina TaxID=2125989 RepID=A0A8J6ITE9_9ALTE|nr:hypothetical protein [Neptunicella marina]MBC3767110.1 hypothetical protein [Neptunicella marina]